MKQEKKRCESCAFGDIFNETCGRTPPILTQIGNKIQDFVWQSPLFPNRRWCGEGAWRDEDGNLVSWTDQRSAADSEAPPHIHWIKIDDEKPPAPPSNSSPMWEEDYLVFRRDRRYHHVSVEPWNGETWSGKDHPFPVTHWAHITPPEE